MALPQVCVTYLIREGAGGHEVLLGRKLQGLGTGKLVGLGGKLEPGEHPRRAAVREIEEEAGLYVDRDRLRHVGVLTYHFPTRPAWSQQSWVYVCREWIGDPRPSGELVPEWHSIARMPVHEMWSDAQHWLMDALTGRFVRASYVFGADLSTAVASDDRSSGLPPTPPPGSLG